MTTIFRAMDMLLNSFTRILIIMVVLYTLGTEMTPSNYQIIIINTCCIWWIISPVIPYIIDIFGEERIMKGGKKQQ